MFKFNRYKIVGLAVLCALYSACKVPEFAQRNENKNVPASFGQTADTTNTGAVQWRSFFTDPHLISLIDTALKNNQELNITLQEIELDQKRNQSQKG
ncbi:hypothetical protein [Pedobacter agri]|uniref:hypothetical protein n=1 Tax=Pedobacter agri TaxID=454586 RepID=UPI0002F92DF7|nr:hypothetical protein [Pedobacter agri]